MSSVEAEDSKRSTSSETTRSSTVRSRPAQMSMKKKAAIINHIICLLGVLFFILFLFFPWATMRDYWREKLTTYSIRNIQQKSQEIKSVTESYFTRLQQASRFLIRATVNTVFITYDTSRIENLVRFSTNFKDTIYPQPQLVIIMATNGTGFFITWPENQEYLLHAFYPETEDMDTIRIYQCTPDVFVNDMSIPDVCTEISSSPFSGWLTVKDRLKELRDFKWSYHSILPDETHTMTNFFNLDIPFNEQNPVEGEFALSGFQLSLVDIATFITDYAKLDKCKFLVTSNDNRALFSSDGVYSEIEPSTYPFINQTKDDYWIKVNDNFDIESRDLQTATIDGHEYSFLSVSLLTDEEVYHNFMMACDISSVINESYTITSKYFVGYLAIVIVVTFVCLFIANRIEKRQEKELEGLASGADLYTASSAGILYKAIQKIHKLELNYPDEIVLNKTLDECVNKIASQHLHPFTCVVDCPFCKQLIQEEPEILPDDPEPCFTSWQTQVGKRLASYKSVGDLRFQWGLHKENPQRMLIKQFFSIIQNESLYFPEIDPDYLLIMFNDFANDFCVDPVLTALQINAVYYIMHTQFKYWVQNKADLAALYFAALFMNADLNKVQEHVVEYRKKNGNVNAEEEFEKEQRIIGRDDALSGIGQDYFVEFLQSYIPGLTQKTPFTDHFIWLFKHLLQSRSYENYFKIFGQFRLLLESPHFAPMERMLDRRDFLLYILTFCNSAPYWSPPAICDEAAIHLAMRNGLDTSNRLDLARLHLAIEKVLISPHVFTLSKFISVEAINKNVAADIQLWEKTVEACIEGGEPETQ